MFLHESLIEKFEDWLKSQSIATVKPNSPQHPYIRFMWNGQMFWATKDNGLRFYSTGELESIKIEFATYLENTR